MGSMIGAVAGIGSALIGANASDDAASQAADAQSQAAGISYAEWKQQQANQAPWLKAGTAGVNALAYGMGLSDSGAPAGATGPVSTQGGLLNAPKFSFDPTQIAKNPDYQFVRDQGTSALASKAAAAGNYGSGNMGTALEQFGQGNASTYMNQYYNQDMNTYNANLNSQYTMPQNFLASISGTGQTAANNLGTEGQAAVNSMGQYTTGAGNAQAAGTLGVSNAYQSGVNTLGSNAASGYNNYLNYTQNQNMNTNPTGNVYGAGYTGYDWTN
jgi:hypothetical protein